MSVALVMGALLFSYNMTVRHRNAQAHAVYFSQTAHGLAEAALSLAWRDLRRSLDERQGEAFTLLTATPSEELAGQSVPITLDPSVTASLLGGLREAEVSAEARVVAAMRRHEGAAAAQGFHPAERRLTLEVTATGRFRGIRRTLAERREALAQLDVLPGLGRFTLFVREPETDDSISPGYNLYANDINGRPDTDAPGINVLPLVLYNHGDTFPRIDPDPQTNGWVYLGGTSPLRLNLTSGADYKYGQYFHFTDVGDASTATQTGFLNDAPPPFFGASHPVGSLTHDYFIKHVIFGWFTVDAGEPPQDMNRDQVLGSYFATGTSMRSSTLHLYGSPICPSPTRVFGPVYHSYAIYSGVTVDVDGDGRRDGLVTLLPAVEPGEFADLPHLAPIPARVRNIGQPGAFIDLDPATLTWTAMFGDDDTYASYQSLIVDDEPYNTALDYMFSRGEFPPASHRLDGALDYPNPGDDVTIEGRDGAGRTFVHVRGDLAELDGSLLRERALVSCADAAEFRRRFLASDGGLVLGTTVHVRSGPLDLPENLVVRRGGVVLAEGSITFDGVTCDAGERLALVSLAGNVVSPFARASASRPAQVDLAAPAGRVGSSDPSHPLAVRGVLAARRLLPTDLRAGGTLIYPSDASPTSPSVLGYLRVHLADAAVGWRF